MRRGRMLSFGIQIKNCISSEYTPNSESYVNGHKLSSTTSTKDRPRAKTKLAVFRTPGQAPLQLGALTWEKSLRLSCTTSRRSQSLPLDLTNLALRLIEVSLSFFQLVSYNDLHHL